MQVHYKGSIGKLSYSELGKIAQYAKDKAVTDVKKTLSYILAQFNVWYSISGVTKLLKRLSFSYKQKVDIPSKLDIKKQNYCYRKL